MSRSLPLISTVSAKHSINTDSWEKDKTDLQDEITISSCPVITKIGSADIEDAGASNIFATADNARDNFSDMDVKSKTPQSYNFFAII